MGHTWAEMDPEGAERQAQAFRDERVVEDKGFTAPLHTTFHDRTVKAGYGSNAVARGCTLCGSVIYNIDLHLLFCPARQS